VFFLNTEYNRHVTENIQCTQEQCCKAMCGAWNY